ncbi:hypothetical protein QBC45DRAFT_39734 [Copromyces sp. CBS 386.78]|nr:hypothetical protein QBC45DRAFT_39734 [Copromyces sp. CBS 386.78]
MDALKDGQGSQPSLAEVVFRNSQLCYPVVLLFAFIISAGIHSIVTSKTEEEVVAPTVKGPGGKPLPFTKRRREHHDTQAPFVHNGDVAKTVFRYLSAGLVLSFVANGAAIALRALSARGVKGEVGDWWCDEQRIVYVAGSAFFYVYVLITLFDWENSPNIVHFITWVLGLGGELVVLISFTLIVTGSHYSNLGAQDPIPKLANGPDGWDLVDLSIGAVRILLITIMVFTYAALTTRKCIKEKQRYDEEASHSDSDESSPLLNGNHPNYQTGSNRCNDRRLPRTGSGFASGNGAGEAGCQQRDAEAAFYRPEKLPHKTWFEYCRGYSVFFPYLWPANSLKLKGIILVCFVLVVFQRVVNIAVPAQMGKVTDSLEPKDGVFTMPWIQVGLLVLYKLLQGPSGLLGSLRSILWIPVSQHTYRALTTAAFEHVHSLSLDFHLGKRTGEVLSALNKGASINQFLEQTTFQVVPMLVDLFIAIIFFYVKFGPMYALFVSVITFYYLYLTIRMASTRADQRRDMVNADREEEAVKNDSITSYETVKYFNAEKYEFARYRNAILNFQAAEAKVTWGMNHMNMCQSMVFMCGFLVIMMTCAYQVSQGTRTLGEFVSLMTYLGQLQGPLNFFGTFYRTIQQAMISGERLLELFKIQPSVIDGPEVVDLARCSGHLKWNNVGFSYDKRRPALHDLSFECKPGTTTAFVGESGGGKSTVFRLMFRYYNCHEGSIQMDGHDVKDLTIDSVRRFIGVVPQDTILFNETLMYNLKYANPNATDEDVYDACRAAAIHDRILSFPDGYATKVGERGLRLSGGEKQRVAIARTILKSPQIIMLDEATSALDGETEQKIQNKLISGNFGKDRTLLIIAHRLSTITHADQIIVLHAGTMVEKGTHEELLALGGRYASMWEKHCRAERAAEHALKATLKAQKLLSRANLSRDDDHSDDCDSMVSSAILQTGLKSPSVGSSTPDNVSDTTSHRGTSSHSDDDSSASVSGSEGTLHDEASDDSHGEDNHNNTYDPRTAAIQPIAGRRDDGQPLSASYASRSRLSLSHSLPPRVRAST